MKRGSKIQDLPFVSVVIPTLNVKIYIEDFLDSYLETNYPNFETIFVDEDSKDGTAQLIRKIYKTKSVKYKLLIIKNRKKMGIAESRNIGIKRAKGKYVIFVEVDMAFKPTWMIELVKYCELNSSVAGAAPKVLDYHKRNLIISAGTKIIKYTGWVILCGFGKDKQLKRYNYSTPTIVAGVGSIIKKDILIKINGFDNLLNRIDDIDLGWRVWIAGYKTVYVPSAVVYHYSSKNVYLRNDISTFWQQFHLSKI